MKNSINLYKPKLKEQQIQKDIMDYLELKHAVVVKVNNTGIRKEDGSYIPPRQKGISDLLVCFQGKFYAIEVKVPGNKTSIFQEEFLQNVRRAKGIAFVAYSIDDVMKHI